MIRRAAPKHPDSTKWYWLRWSATELDGGSIVSSQWTLPAGLVLEDSAIVADLVGMKISGGLLQSDYEVWNRIVTDGPGEDLRESILIRIRESGH